MALEKVLLLCLIVSLAAAQPDPSTWHCNGPTCNLEDCHLFNPEHWCMPADCKGGCDWHPCEHACLMKESKIDEECMKTHKCGKQMSCKVDYIHPDEFEPSYCEKWLKCLLDNKCVEYRQECKCPHNYAFNHARGHAIHTHDEL